MRNPRQVAVVGVTGYTGLELARILLRHPELPPPAFYVREPNGAKCLAELFPQFRAWGEAPLRPLSVDGIASSNAGTAFLATPHEVSAELAPDFCAMSLSDTSIEERSIINSLAATRSFSAVPFFPPASLVGTVVFTCGPMAARGENARRR